MLNAIAVSLTAYLLRKWGGIVGNSIQTKQLPKDSWVPGHPADPGRPQRGARPGRRRGARRRRLRRAAEPVPLRLRAPRDGCLRDRRGGQRDRRTPDGGDLDDHLRRHRRRWSGCRCCSATPTPTAPTFQSGLGFAGIAVALLGRNNPVGIAFGALLFAFLVEQSSLLEINAGVSNDIVAITQGVLVLSVVVAYEIVRRYTPGPGAARRGRAARPDRDRETEVAGMTVANDAARARARRAAPSTPAPRGPGRGPGCWSPSRWSRFAPGDHRQPTSSTRPAPCARRITATIPIALAGLGGLWSERAGVVNIGLEGMMILGTIGARLLRLLLRPLAGRRSRAMLVRRRSAALLHALATVIFGVDHIVSGVAINIMAVGRRGVPRRDLRSPASRAAARRSRRRSTDPAAINLPGVADWAKTVEDKHWFVVSDLASVLGALTRNLSLADRPRRCCWSSRPTWSCGARRSACGCARAARARSAAETLGVNVYRYKYHRGADLRRARRPRRRLPRAGRRRALPERPDQRPRLHRPGRDDLRQLAARRAAARLRAVRLHRRACGCAAAAARCTRCCSWSRSCCCVYGVLPAAQGRAPAPAS